MSSGAFIMLTNRELGQALLCVPLEHSFDDLFPFCSRAKSNITSAMWAFRRLVHLVGLRPDPDKLQLPASIGSSLGVVFDTRGTLQSSRLQVKPKPAHISNTLTGQV